MRIVHIADLHLNKAITKSMRGDIPVGVYDTLARLDFAIDYALSVGADVFIVAGDIFDTRNPLPEYRQMLYSRLDKLQGMWVLLILGNHDQAPNGKEHSLHDIASLSKGKVVVADKPKTIQVDGVRFVLIPWQYGLNDLPIINNVGITIAVCHASIEGSKGTGDRPLLLGEREFLLPSSYFDHCQYVAMGHIHHPQTIGQIVYPGSVNVLDWGEQDPHYVMDITVIGRQVTWQHIPYPIIRPRYDLVYTVGTWREIVLPTISPDALCRITIHWTGERDQTTTRPSPGLECLVRQVERRRNRPEWEQINEAMTDWELLSAYLVQQGCDPTEYESLWTTLQNTGG